MYSKHIPFGTHSLAVRHISPMFRVSKILIVGHHVLETCVLLSNWFTVNPVASPVTVPNSRVERLTLLFLTCRGLNCITDYVIKLVKTISSFCCSLLWDFYLVDFQPHILFISNVVIWHKHHQRNQFNTSYYCTSGRNRTSIRRVGAAYFNR